MGWDVPYAVEMERRLRPFNPKWIEEPLMPHDLEGYRYLASKFETPISAGEHVYTRYGFQQLIATGAISFLQPDVNRVGGYSEAIKIWALAEARDMHVVPHSNESHNLHMVFARTNSPLLEYFPHTAVNTGNEMFWELFDGEPRATDGYVEPITAPGLGITLRQDTLAKYAVAGV
jgi:L-alanine-DL-glutamate epimerase-like enolase superfamily enzyme